MLLLRILARLAFCVALSVPTMIWTHSGKYLEGEFITLDAGATIRTMVERPNVNHVPTMIGGFGRRELYRYYKYHFIPQNRARR